MFRIVATALALCAGCTTPCDALDARARDCHAAPSRYVDDRYAACTALREDLGTETFDRYASCVREAECGDRDAIERCEARHIGEDTASCLHYRLWAAACGLEPTGTNDDCATLRDGLSDAVFEQWVTCITTDGCPKGDDPRYDVCQDVLFPPAAGQLIDACVLLIQWTGQCADEAPDFFPVTETDLVGCVTLAEPFSSESFLDYASCLSEIACDDVPGRLDCLLRLELLDPTGATAPCERLVAYSNTCGTELGGGSVQACTRLFARFTPESLDDFVTCIEAQPCDQSDVTACVGLLQAQ
jgi:hypothetical protein